MTILDSADVLQLDTKFYSGSGSLLDRSGNGHDAALPGGTNNPLWLPHNGGIRNKYTFFPGLAGNNVTVTLDISTIYDYTITYEDGTTDNTGTQTSSGAGVLTFGNTDVLFAGLDVVLIDVTADGGGATLALFDARRLTQPYATYTDDIPEVWTINRAASGRVLTVVDRPWFSHTTDDYLTVADTADLDFADGVDFTIIFLGRTHRFTTNGFPFDKSGGFGATDTGYRMDLHSSGAIRGEYADGSFEEADLTGTGVDGQTFTAAMTRDAVGDEELEAFFNGVGSGSPGTQPTGDLSNALSLDIGRVSGGSNFYEGLFGALYVWRSKITDTEITEAHDLLTVLPAALPPFPPRPRRLVRM